GEPGVADRLHAEQPGLAVRFDTFVKEFGYRGPSEWDPGMDSWETKPELPLALIDRLRQLEDEQEPTLRKQAHETIAAGALDEARQILGDNEEAVQTLH